MNEKIVPYQSCSKSVFIILGIILMGWCTFFSIFLIIQGAWPVSIFLGAEYLVIFYLIKLYLKEINTIDQIKINEKEIFIEKLKGDKILSSLKFSSYWSKIFFYKNENKSKLIIRESNKQIEVAMFLHTEIKEALYIKINKYLSSIRK